MQLKRDFGNGIPFLFYIKFCMFGSIIITTHKLTDEIIY
ncbi:hypothetical protein BDD43_5686 [Mucilaginibacter gracilis]|uniref:Uncharacterized protein n=1 Tax=Mucilaginibacter gracilis TaxID=423350 RepID=A0A495J8T8_9SPHI|nr:hypothetical protein BDD43_5686 [Mucilaginibacter gracilis]